MTTKVHETITVTGTLPPGYLDDWLRDRAWQAAMVREHRLNPAEAAASFATLVEIGAVGWWQ